MLKKALYTVLIMALIMLSLFIWFMATASVDSYHGRKYTPTLIPDPLSDLYYNLKYSSDVIPDEDPDFHIWDADFSEVREGVMENVVRFSITVSTENQNETAKEIAKKYNAVFLGGNHSLHTYTIRIPSSVLKDKSLEEIAKEIKMVDGVIGAGPRHYTLPRF